MQTKTKISTQALREKLERTPHAALASALLNPDVDPAIKRHVAFELDARANRGTSRGFGEAA